MADTTLWVENYELKICSIMRQILEIERLLEQKKGIKTFARANPDKVVDAIVKLQNARFELEKAMRCLLDSGDPGKK